MAVSTPEQQIVTITIPAEYIGDFRTAVVREIESDAQWVRGQHKEVIDDLAAGKNDRIETHGADEIGAMNALHEVVRLLSQMPDDDVEATVSSAPSTVFHVLEQMGRGLSKRVADLYGYAPVPFLELTALLDRLQWTNDTALEVSR